MKKKTGEFLFELFKFLLLEKCHQNISFLLIFWQASEKKILLAQMISMYSNMLKNKTKNQTPEHLREIIEAFEQYKTQFSESLKKANDIIEVANLPVSINNFLCFII